ncbi:MAG: HypC/HybG/HupF family hydrogenase formation chaperone [Verrucomicrobia bacterium]|nr:MAG: HypC/HybG/HupF family hydrogenase formation chaperone [Verrucomicrobiota bacterium]
MCLAVPGQILSIQETDDPLQRTGRVSFGGIVREVNLAYVPEAKVGDYVVVHVGFALSIVDEEEARQTLDYFRQMGQAGGETVAADGQTPEAAGRAETT